MKKSFSILILLSFFNTTIFGQNLSTGISDTGKITINVDTTSLESLIQIQEKVKSGITIEAALLEEAIIRKQIKFPPAKIYGQELFRNKSISVFRNSKNIKPPKDYILGIGDVLTVSIFGDSQYDGQFKIGSNGYIQPDRMPKIFLNGLKLKQAEELVKNRFSRFFLFGKDQFAFSLSDARTITINIFGEVSSSGSFNLPAVNTAFNALVAAGGPSDIGSVRNIKIIRSGETKILDVYEFMTTPQAQFGFFLGHNDIIQVPIAERIVDIQGAIKRPFRYELKPNENLTALIKYAGGLPPDAYTKLIQIKRFVNGNQELIDVNLEQLQNTKSDFLLENGDEIFIRRIKTGVNNSVEIKGSVEFPGEYALANTPRIYDLIKKGILKPEARLDIAFLLRLNRDKTTKLTQIDLQNIIDNKNEKENLLLRKGDQLVIYTQERFVDKTTIKVTGAVREPIIHPFDPDSTLTIQQAVLLAGGLKPEAISKAYLVRKNLENIMEKEYLEVDIKAAIANPKGPANISLKPLDELKILSGVTFTNDATVKVSGEVRSPGEFQYARSLRIGDLITLSGGLKLGAKEKAYLLRTNPENIREKEYIEVDIMAALENPSSPQNIIIEPLDELKIFSKEMFTDKATIRISGEVRNPGEFQYAKSFKLKDLITLSGGVKFGAALNRIDIYRLEFNENSPSKTIIKTLEIDSSLSRINGLEQSLELEPYDELVVRTIPNFEFQKYIQLNGEVNYPGRYALINDNETLLNIIQRAGGLTEEAFAEGATLYRTYNNKGWVVTKLDQVLRKKNSEYNYILKEGDVITIPEKEDLVTIKTQNTRAIELYPDKFVKSNRINISYTPGKKAKWYIKKYAVGFGTKAARKKVTVEQPNGELHRTRSFVLFKIYPKVEKGSIISIGTKILKP